MVKHFTILILSVFIFSSCEKDKVSEATRNISQQWKLLLYEIDGVNQTDQFKQQHDDYTILFDDNGVYTEIYVTAGGVTNITGTWIFLNGISEIKLIDNSQTRIFEIVEIELKTLTIEYNGNGVSEMFYFVPI